jgi:hypothetical protein
MLGWGQVTFFTTSDVKKVPDLLFGAEALRSVSSKLAQDSTDAVGVKGQEVGYFSQSIAVDDMSPLNDAAPL